MPRIMWDSINARSIYNQTRNPQMVAGYVDKIKLEPWSQADWALFPNAVKVQIVKKASSNFGHVLDVEPGDATPAEAPGWVKMRRAAGLATPTIYCNTSTWPTVQKAFRDQGVAQPLYWVAHYDDKKEFPTLNGITAVAKQYHGNDPANYDLSYVADYWPGVDGKEMALTSDDAAVVWDGAVIDKNTNATTKAREVLGWAHWEAHQANVKLSGLSAAIGDLRSLIIADDANDVTADAVAQALRGIIVAEVVPAVKQAAQEALADADVEATLSDEKVAQIAGTTADILHDRLAG